jgi:recombination protein RecT
MTKQSKEAQTQAQSTAPAIIKTDIVNMVAARIRRFLADGEIHLPPGYSPENAMKSAWLTLQETVDLNSAPALEVCTKASISNALLDMIVQGLNPGKKQGYFIVYGKKLAFQRSYFGSMALAQMIDPEIADIVAECVFKGDTFKFKIEKGKKIISEHESSLENIGKDIQAAYAMTIDKAGNVKGTVIMTFDEIKQSWKQSKMKPVLENGGLKPGSTHEKFTADMCKRTVINKICKPIINSSDDNHLLMEAINRSSEINAEETAAMEIEEHANTEVIDIIDHKQIEEQTSGGEESQTQDQNQKTPGPTKKAGPDF